MSTTDLSVLSALEMSLASALGHNTRTGSDLKIPNVRVTTKEGATVEEGVIRIEELLTLAKEVRFGKYIVDRFENDESLLEFF